MTDHK